MSRPSLHDRITTAFEITDVYKFEPETFIGTQLEGYTVKLVEQTGSLGKFVVVQYSVPVAMDKFRDEKEIIAPFYCTRSAIQLVADLLNPEKFTVDAETGELVRRNSTTDKIAAEREGLGITPPAVDVQPVAEADLRSPPTPGRVPTPQAAFVPLPPAETDAPTVNAERDAIRNGLETGILSFIIAETRVCPPGFESSHEFHKHNLECLRKKSTNELKWLWKLSQDFREVSKAQAEAAGQVVSHCMNTLYFNQAGNVVIV